MSIKLSDIEKYVQKKIIIIDGVPQWEEVKLNGEIIFNDLTTELVEKLNNEVIQKLIGVETEEEVAYKMLPYIVQVEDDINYDRFTKLMEKKNVIILMLYEGIMKIINGLFDYAANIDRVTEQENQLKMRMPQENTEEKIIRLTKEMENEKDTKKKKTLLLKLAELYEKVENNE